jgi:hypothetical protein
MPVLTLDYRHCDRMRPKYLRHPEVEEIARQARSQLVAPGIDAIPLAALSAITGLRINGIAFELYVDTDNPVHDEAGNPVLGICEYDPAEPDATLVSVCPVGENASPELVLSTLAHETGHAIFDAPGWIVAAGQGPGLFDDPDKPARTAYRTMTRDGQHLARTVPSGVGQERSLDPAVGSDAYFAELRANEFMGSLLVPRERLRVAAEELATACVAVHRGPLFGLMFSSTGCSLAADADFADLDMEVFLRALALRFGVSPRFIRVRLQRYGLLNSGALIA